MQNFYVSIPVKQAAEQITDYIVNGSITGDCLDAFTVADSEHFTAMVLVFEKHYYRAGNRLTLTVTLDNSMGDTRVHTVGGGGGEGLFRFDWGASESFEDAAMEALQKYIIR